MSRLRKNTNDMFDGTLLSAGELSSAELRFVDEYLIDRDPMLAAIRTGVASIVLKKTVIKWMNDGRIRQAIQLKTDSIELDLMITPQRIMAGFIDVAFDRAAPSSARNSALRELAALKKMYPDDADKGKQRSGVVFIPGVLSIKDWDEAAQAQQNALKEDVKL